ncbi:unnamed protein product [Brassica rapa]|uniref:Uncharacterized protein n=1 Tax=Brassica campestris TaxID=3711 RepID=A0A8D9HCR0_BRACM|nr:unnamed protein product [Brassica rapa]
MSFPMLEGTFPPSNTTQGRSNTLISLNLVKNKLVAIGVLLSRNKRVLRLGFFTSVSTLNVSSSQRTTASLRDLQGDFEFAVDVSMCFKSESFNVSFRNNHMSLHQFFYAYICNMSNAHSIEIHWH